MNYIIEEILIENNVQFTAGSKARTDIVDILSKRGFQICKVLYSPQNRKNSNTYSKITQHKNVESEWRKSLLQVRKGDTLVIQFPVINHSVFLYRTVKECHKRGVKIVLIIHDLEVFRFALRNTISFRTKIRINYEEKKLLKLADKIIVHNKYMTEKLVSLGFQKSKMIELEIFDYLIPSFETSSSNLIRNLTAPVIVAGALKKHKSGYVYDLPKKTNFNLYGIGYEEQDKPNIKYYGAFLPEILPFNLNGSFGLVWDGESSDTCTGIYGEYLRINNPHKTSLYIASGIPVIIWEEAALAEFVVSNNLGFTIRSLDEIPEKLELISSSEYKFFIENVNRIGKLLRGGYYTINAINKSV